MNSEEVMRLEDVLEVLDRKISSLEKTKQFLDNIKRYLDEVYKCEIGFHEFFSKCRQSNRRLSLFFDETEYSDKFQTIHEELNKINLNYENKRETFEQKIASERLFSGDKLEEYSKDMCTFFSDMTKQLSDIMERQKRIFSKGKEEINEKGNMLNRLLNTFLRKVGHSPKTEEIRRFFEKKQSELHNILTSIPSDLEDLGKMDEGTIRGLYEKTRREILTYREEIRRFATKNNLLSEDEATLLEAIYEIESEELEFIEAIELLTKKISLKEEKIQNVLLELSKKGFIILKLIAD